MKTKISCPFASMKLPPYKQPSCILNGHCPTVSGDAYKYNGLMDLYVGQCSVARSS